MRQKRQLAVYFSMILLRANCASFVIMSASSNTMSLIPLENNRRVPANSLISLRTTSIPRSSEAFNSSVMFL